MKLAAIQCPLRSRRPAKRLGQGAGSGTGKTAGKGHKGQRARSGARRGNRAGFEGGQMRLIRRIPKIGFSNHRFKTAYQVVNLAAIDSAGLEGEVGPEELRQAGLIKKTTLPVKILGVGALSRTLKLKAHKFSRSAAARITQGGGQAEVI